jgi:hypothetical protein
MYFMANDPRVPDDVRRAMGEWGLAKDEFTDNDNWPHQIYVREARRMIGRYVMTENELLGRRPTPVPIGMGSYTIDSHNVQRYVTPEGHVQNEGDIGVGTDGPYQIALGSILPKQDECTNLVVPVCVSASHIAFGSIRMEPVFMILGQSAATTACLAIERDVAVQQVAYDALRERLLADGQVLQGSGPRSTSGNSVDPTELEGIVVDDADAKLTGDWSHSRATGRFVAGSYRHDGAVGDGQRTAVFEVRLPNSGKYEVRLAYSSYANRATRVPIVVRHAGGEERVVVNQRTPPPIDGIFQTVGTFDFTKDAPAVVTVTNRGADGHVIIDAVQWLPTP